MGQGCQCSPAVDARQGLFLGYRQYMPVVGGLGVAVCADLSGGTQDPTEFRHAWRRCLLDDTTGDIATVIASNQSMAALTQVITLRLIEQQRGRLLMLHAAALGHPKTGRTVAFVAPGGTGKTTLVRTLGCRYGYITDETVGVDPGTLAVLPYPKPLSIRREDSPEIKDEWSPDELGLLPAPHAPVLAKMVLLRRVAGLDELEIVELSLADAIMGIVPETSSLPLLPRPLHLLANVIERTGGVVLARYGDATQLEPWVVDQLGDAAL